MWYTCPPTVLPLCVNDIIGGCFCSCIHGREDDNSSVFVLFCLWVKTVIKNTSLFSIFLTVSFFSFAVLWMSNRCLQQKSYFPFLFNHKHCQNPSLRAGIPMFRSLHLITFWTRIYKKKMVILNHCTRAVDGNKVKYIDLFPWWIPIHFLFIYFFRKYPYMQYVYGELWVLMEWGLYGIGFIVKSLSNFSPLLWVLSETMRKVKRTQRAEDSVFVVLLVTIVHQNVSNSLSVSNNSLLSYGEGLLDEIKMLINFSELKIMHLLNYICYIFRWGDSR